MLLTGVDDVSRYGMVSIDNNQRITAFNEKGKNSGGGTINAGIYLLKKKLLESIPSGCQYSLEKQFFPQLIIMNELYGYQSKGSFIDIGTSESYRLAQNNLKSVKQTDR
jgi:NDP-sugar pyrophosphorylase family protein